MTTPGPLLPRVKEILSREWLVPAADIPDDAAINVFEKWDSIGHISIMLALEAEFGIEISADTVQALVTLPKIIAYLEENRKA